MYNIPIKLNFFALANQDISFKVYRQEFHGQPKQLGFYKKKLPKVPGGEYADYWVTFQRQQDFECFSCSQKDNPYLTLDLIWETFLQKIKEKLDETEYIINDKKYFSRFISLIIADHNEGKEVINIEPYYLKEDDKFGFLADFRFKRNQAVLFSRKIQQLSLSLDRNFYSNRNYYSDKYDKIKIFVKKYLSKIFPLLIEDNEYDLENNLFSMTPQYLKTKIYIFKDKKESNSQFKGIKDNGPVSSVDKDPLLVFIFQESQKNLANDVYNAITGKAYTFTFPGMEKMFGLKLTTENVTKINIKSFTKDELENVDAEIDRIMSKNSDRKILGLFIEHSRDTVADSEFSPYYFLKYIFTKKEVPLQAVTIERIKGRDGLKWSASGIGLQIFAKLGGIPWKVRPSNEKCIIFGLGSAHEKEKTTGSIKKYFAYSVCMDSSGIYKKIDVLGASIKKDDYIRQLKENIKNVISEYLNDDIYKCVIHLPFKIKKDEIQGIKNSVDSISSEHEKIEFQFIKINTDNKFFGFAENNSKVPYESSYVKLSKNEYLVWFEGLQYGRENVSKKVGNPVHIEFIEDYALNEEERKKYLQDIINLSGANWRGFNAKLSPISIYYPEIIAKYVSEFRKYEEDGSINISNINIPWFL